MLSLFEHIFIIIPYSLYSKSNSPLHPFNLGKVPPLLREKIWNNYRTDRVPIPHYNTHLSMKKCKKLGEALDKLYRFYQPEEIFTEIIPSLRLKDAVMLIELLSSKIRSLQEQNDSSQLTG